MSESMVHEGVTEQIHRNEPVAKVKLIRGQGGTYGWEISMSGPSMRKCLEETGITDRTLARVYTNESTEAEE